MDSWSTSSSLCPPVRLKEILLCIQAVRVSSHFPAKLFWLFSHGRQIILGHKCHLLLYEQGGVAQIGGVHPRAVWNQKDGTMDLKDIAGAIRDEDPHYPR